MTALPIPPITQPFPPAFADDQLAPLHALLADASPAQRQWLAGYVSGYGAAAQLRAPSAPVAPRPRLTILFGSESGNAAQLANAARRTAQRLGIAASVRDLADIVPADLSGDVLVIIATWGEGDPPQRAEPFHAALMAADAPNLAGLRFAVLALGDRAYAQFCATGRQIDARLAELGGRRLAERVECDTDFAAPAAGWIRTTLGLLAPADPAHGAASSVIHVDFAPGEEPVAQSPAPILAEITAHTNLNSSRSDQVTAHLVVSLAGSGLSYRPGDAIGVRPTNHPDLVAAILASSGLAGEADLARDLADSLDITTLTAPQLASYAALSGSESLGALAADDAAAQAWLAGRQLIDLLEHSPARLSPEQLRGLLRPLVPRFYSVASSQALVGEEAHLLVSRRRWQAHGRARFGVASNDLAARRVGAAIPVFVRPNPHFRPPADDAAAIMIGPGTGVAPFRGFLQEREARGARGRNWLFFGARRFHDDFLYQTDWQDWLASGKLTRIDLAFSRDQPERVHVQARMWAARAELYGWLQEGATLYVCGDAGAMARDVHAMLIAILADQSGKDAESATAWLRDLQRGGRYLRDVY